MIELSHIYANLDKHLYKAQIQYEEVIEKYGEAREYYAECVIEYEKAFAEEVKKLNSKNIPVTIVKEIAKLNCIEQYEKMLKAKALYKKYKANKEAYEERINTIKFLSKIKFNMFVLEQDKEI